MKLAINSIYRATEGEGVHIGESQIFVRFQGCNIGCLNCDSKDTWDFSAGEQIELDSVIAKIKELGKTDYLPLKRVSITGGDPLHPQLGPTVLALAKRLKAEDYYINVEASGTRVCKELFDLIDFISFDYKTPSTGVITPIENIFKMLELYSGKMQIKSVVASKHDFYYCLEALELSKKDPKVTWCLTPAYTPGENFEIEKFQQILELNQKTGSFFKVIGQQHKWVYGADKKQV